MLNSLALRASVGRAIGCLLVSADSTSCVAGETSPPGDGINVPSTVDLTRVLPVPPEQNLWLKNSRQFRPKEMGRFLKALEPVQLPPSDGTNMGTRCTSV